jgi:hypothetical protein
MAIDLHTLPHPDFLPIPDDVEPNARWSPLMIEIADHIGASLTLKLLDHFGGQFVNVPQNPDRNPFRAVIGDAAADIVTRVFANERLHLPTGRRLPMLAGRASSPAFAWATSTLPRLPVSYGPAAAI